MVSVVMPVRNEAAFIEGAVRSVVAAGRTVEAFEVLVVDGMSDDGTREAVTRLAEEHPQVRLLDNPRHTVPHAMNLGIAAARGDVVVRVDGHAEVAPDFLQRGLEELAAHPECACAGGVIENVELTPWSEAISAAMRSTFGVGNATFRTGGREGYVDTLAFGAYRKADLLAIGGFDEELVRNQDDEFNHRLLRSGGRILLVPSVVIDYFARGTLSQLGRMMYQYGLFKPLAARKLGGATTVRQLVPPAFVAALGATLALSPASAAMRVLFLLIVLAYASVVVLVALRQLPRHGAAVALRLLAAIPTIHVAYGAGYLRGIWDFVIRARRLHGGGDAIPVTR